MNLRSSSPRQPAIVADSDQRIIKIEETSAYHRSKHRAAIELRDSVKTRELLTKVIGTHRIESPATAQQHRFDIDHLSTGNLDLVKIQWDGAFELIQDPLVNRYVIYLGLAGSLTQQINCSQTFCCLPDTATIMNAGETVTSVTSEVGELLLISIDLSLINLALSKILDKTLKQPLVFQPHIDLTSELGLSLKKFGQFLWAAADKNNPTEFSALVLQKLEQAFLDCMIEGLPSNYAEELLYQNDGALSCHVRKAQMFIESNLHEDIKLGDIVTAVGVCSRLLQKAFSHHCGCSPMRFLTKARLQRIRQELERSTHDTKIVDVMMHYGFTQGGKFAKEYQQLFGEKPSDTLKRSSDDSQQQQNPWQNIDDIDSEQLAGGRSRSSRQSIFQLNFSPVSEINICLNSAYLKSSI
jgi:AraC-like DNA-binding protein